MIFELQTRCLKPFQVELHAPRSASDAPKLNPSNSYVKDVLSLAIERFLTEKVPKIGLVCYLNFSGNHHRHRVAKQACQY